jgi:alpha-D-ribose 1-methylphosphonate 5-triphosphate diphosphatase
LVLPGIIDLHGDAFERQWMPRPRVFFPVEMALLETDRQLLANGITTAFHGLTVSWEPGLRGVEHGRQMFEALRHIEGQLRCDTRLHLRFEIYALDEAPELIRWVEAGRVDLIAFNDHLEMVAAHLDDENKAGKYAERSGLSVDGFRQLPGQTRARSGEVQGVIEQLAAAGRARQIPMASHDDETPEMREFYQSLGSTICEFPVDELTARSAIERGSEVVMGGPNVVRGGSHAKRMTAMDAIRGGYCTVLASDYYYPSLLHAAFRVAGTGAASLAEVWQLISENPARAAGLNDRGQLAPGKRADLTVVDDTHPAHPRVAATFTGGRAVYCAEPALVGNIHEPVFG